MKKTRIGEKSLRKISVVTTSRADYGIIKPVLDEMRGRSNILLHLIVSGTHLSPKFGSTLRAIKSDGFKVIDKIKMPLSSDSPECIANAMGRALIGFARVYAKAKPDMLLVTGDRFEMHAAAAAAVPFNIPIAHIHGGEITEGAFDDAFRHSITKMSHLHFVSTEAHARRINQMGEEPWRVTVSGAPALDNLRQIRILGKEKLERMIGLKFDLPPLIVTFHPVTLEFDRTNIWIGELLNALRRFRNPVVFTMPNADTHSRVISDSISEFVQDAPDRKFVACLGTQTYFSLMAAAAAMVGNSSSGIIEAASFGLPVVNIGTRQRGRQCSKNVIHVGYGQADIIRGIRRALSPGFKSSLRTIKNLYGDGGAAERIVKRIAQVPLNRRLLVKQFHDLPANAMIGRKSR